MRTISLLALVLALGSPSLAQARELTAGDVEALVQSVWEIRAQMDSAWAAEAEEERGPHGVAVHRQLITMRNRLAGRDGRGTALVRAGVDATMRHVHGQRGFLRTDLAVPMGEVCTMEVALRALVTAEFKAERGFDDLPTCISTGPSKQPVTTD